MADDKSEYPAMLATLQPHDAIHVLEARLRQIGRLNNDIADWLQERRKIEEQYSAGLRKLAKRPVIDDPVDLGVFSTPWSNLVEGVDTLAESHSVLARKIESDIERPLRDFRTTSRDFQQLNTAQNDLSSVSRDVDAARRKLDKLEHRNQRSQTNRNTDNMNEDLDTAQAHWDSQAPYVFENLQSLDENRMTILRDLLTQFQTHEMDQLERDRQVVERALNTLVQVETADEVKTFVLRTMNRKHSQRPAPAPPQERRQSRSSALASSPTVASFSPGVQRTDSPAASMDDSPGADTVPDLPSQKPDKPLRGFRRLGTVLGRRRHSKMPAGADRVVELGGSPEKRDNRRSMLQSSSTFANLTSKMSRSRTDLNLGPPSAAKDSTERPRSPLRTISSLTDSTNQPRTPGAGNGSRPELTRLPSSDMPPRLPDPITQIDSSSSLQHELNASGNQAQTPGPVSQAVATNGTGQPAELSQTQTPDQGNESWPSRAELDDPISRALREAAGDATPSQLNVSISQAPTTRDEGDANALAEMANKLRMQAPMANPRKTGTVRGRREMRASVYSPGSLNPFGPHGAATNQASSVVATTASDVRPQPSRVSSLPKSTSTPFLSQPMSSTPFSPSFDAPNTSTSAQFPMQPPPAIRQNSVVEDGGSIRSGRSLGSTTSHPQKHPEPDAPGLNTSIIETVSAWCEDGRVTRSMMIGEVALGYKPLDDGTGPATSGVIRLDNYSSLEKVAPNPAFVSNTTEHHLEPDCYTIDYNTLGSRSQVAFKYQVHIPKETPGLHAPLLLVPAWKIDGTTTSVILTVGLNPAFEFDPQQSSITLANVTVALYLGEGSAKAVSCQSKPVGVFNKDRNCIYWSLGELAFASGHSDSSTQKLLARFTTEDGPAKEGKVDAKWEVVGSSNDAGVPTRLGSGVQVCLKTNSEAAVEEDPFSDQDAGLGSPVPAVSASNTTAGWSAVRASTRKMVSGTYTGR